MIKQILKKEKVKSYMTVSEEIFPFVMCYKGKEYEVRYTMKGGLFMTGRKKEDENVEKSQ